MNRVTNGVLLQMEEPEESLTNQESDHQLLGRFRGGDDDAAFSLYLKYAQRLISLAQRQTPRDLASRLDPEDIVQSVFRTFFRRASAGQYQVPEGEELWKLLLVISLNKVRALGAFHRAEKRNVGRTHSIVDGALLHGNTDDQTTARQILEISIEEVISNLPESHRDIVRLRIEGHEIKEIAERAQRSKRTVERVLQSFRESMVQAIQEK